MVTYCGTSFRPSCSCTAVKMSERLEKRGVVDVGAGCGAMLRIDVEHALVSGLVDHRLIDFPLDQLGQMLRTTDLVLLHP